MSATKFHTYFVIIFIIPFLSLSAYGQQFNASQGYSDLLGGAYLSNSAVQFSDTNSRWFWHLDFDQPGTYYVSALIQTTSSQTNSTLRIGNYEPTFGELDFCSTILAENTTAQWVDLGPISIPESGLHYIFARAAEIKNSTAGDIQSIKFQGPGYVSNSVSWQGRAAAAFYGVSELTINRKAKYVEMVPRPWPIEAIGGTHTVAIISGSYSHNNDNIAYSLWNSNDTLPQPLVSNGGTRVFTHEGTGSTIELDDFYLDPTRRRKIIIFRTPDGSGNTITSVCGGEVGQRWHLVGRIKEFAAVYLSGGYGFIENFSKFNAHYYQRSCAWGNSFSFGTHNNSQTWLENVAVTADFKNPADNPDPLTTGVFRWGKSFLNKDMVEIIIGGQLEDINGGSAINYDLPTDRPLPQMPTLNLLCSLNEPDQSYQLADAAKNLNYSFDLTNIINDPYSNYNFQFQKVSGPVWLNVATNGQLSGIPTGDTVGQNIFTVRAYSDQLGIDGLFTIAIYSKDTTNNSPAFINIPIEIKTAPTLDDPVLAKINFHDPDIANTHTLAIIAGNSQNFFTIDQINKSIIKNQMPTAGNYPLTISLTDNIATVTADINIEVVNNNIQTGATKDIWYILEGDTLTELLTSPRYPDNPSITGAVADLTEDYMGKSTGYRIRGYLYPPTTGTYTFWAIGDKECELYLSTDQSKTNLVKRADDAPLLSSSVTLNASQRYYFEALAKAGNSSAGDFNVQWQGPGFSQQIIKAQYLSPIEFVQPDFGTDLIILRDELIGENYQENLRPKLKSLDMWDVLHYTKISGPAWLIINTDGSISGQATASDVGMNTFTVRAFAPGGLYDQTTLQINVKANTAPVFNYNSNNIPEIDMGELFTGTLAPLANDVDIEPRLGFGDQLTFSKESGPDWLSVNPDGQYYGKPLDSDVGLNTFVFKVTDIGGLSKTIIVNIKVNLINRPPVALNNPIKFDAYPDVLFNAHLRKDIIDPDELNNLTFTKVSGPAWLTVNDNGFITGTPPEPIDRTDNFIIRITDNKNESIDVDLDINLPIPGPDTYDDFTGTAGDSLSENNSGFGWADFWSGDANWIITSPGLQFPDLITDGLKVSMGSQGSTIQRTLADTINVSSGQSSEIWIAVLMDIKATDGIKPGHSIQLALYNGTSKIGYLGKGVNKTIGFEFNNTFIPLSGSLGTGDSCAGNWLMLLKFTAQSDSTQIDMYATRDDDVFDITDPMTFDHTATTTIDQTITFNGLGLYRWNNEDSFVDEIKIAKSYNLIIGQPNPDLSAPQPAPLTWVQSPAPVSNNSVSMTVSAANDTAGVQYYFACLQDSNCDSEWQNSSTYIAKNLLIDQQYDFIAAVRDKSTYNNQTLPSALASTIIKLYNGSDGLSDFRLLSNNWLSTACGYCDGVDLNGDGNVNLEDLKILTENWLAN
ncbi:MAG: hypothetical protein JEZ07_02175 [Phycisphaerae bacterium]|nr:hypothetical protein [Phycisphaerae bacterium]